MKLIIAFVLGISFILSGCSGDDRKITADLINFPPAADGEQAKDAPVIQFDSTIVHFGKIVIGEKVNHTFRFVNTGKTPLIISQVTPSCGCTTPKKWPTDPVLPGESGEISVEFNSTGFPGKIEKSVSVLTNCIPRNINLQISGEVIGVEAFESRPKGIEMERER